MGARVTAFGLVLALIGPGVVAMVSEAVATEPETLAPRLVCLAAFTALIIAVAWIALRRERLTLRQIGFAGSGWIATPLLAIALTLFFVFAFGPAAYALVNLLALDGFSGRIARLNQLPLWYLIFAILIVAAGEEWLYRGYAIERLAALTGSRVTAGALSLVAFAIAHLPLWGPAVALTTLFSGAILTAMYLWRRDILALMLAHVATDIIGIVLAAR